LRDRDRIFGDAFTRQVHDMGIEQVLCAPRSPWQRAYIERVIGTIRHECLDYMIIFTSDFGFCRGKIHLVRLSHLHELLNLTQEIAFQLQL
jgi:transposase InsO family protein